MTSDTSAFASSLHTMSCHPHSLCGKSPTIPTCKTAADVECLNFDHLEPHDDSIPIVFVPGHKGIQLCDEKTGSAGWFNAIQATGFSTPNLRLPLQWKGDTQARDAWISKDPVKKVAHVKVYSPFFAWLEEYSRNTHSPVVTFSYDWRRECSENIVPFAEFIKALYVKLGSKPIQIISHSLSGPWVLISIKEFLLPSISIDKAKYIHSMCFIGCPFGSGIGFMKDMFHGMRTLSGYNHELMSPSVLWTYPSSYEIGFPLVGEDTYGLTYLENADHEPLDTDVDYHSLSFWKDNGFGPFSDPDFVLTKEWEEHLLSALDRAKAFRKRLLACSDGQGDGNDSEWAPMCAIGGTGRSTLITLMKVKDEEGAGEHWDFEKSKRDHTGDGRVGPLTVVRPQRFTNCKIFSSDHIHWLLPQDIRTVNLAVEHLRKCDCSAGDDRCKCDDGDADGDFDKDLDKNDHRLDRL